ncbi:MAG: hypothetical protein ACPLPR_01560 [Bacillota bacterium]
MAVLVTIKDPTGNVAGELLATEQVFRTGSRGFFTQGKAVIEGRYQAQVQLVEIGSRPAREGISREA